MMSGVQPLNTGETPPDQLQTAPEEENSFFPHIARFKIEPRVF